MSLKATWVLSGQGEVELDLADLDDDQLTPEGVEAYLLEGAQLEVHEQGNYMIDLRTHWTSDQLADAIADELEMRANEGRL